MYLSSFRAVSRPVPALFLLRRQLQCFSTLFGLLFTFARVPFGFRKGHDFPHGPVVGFGEPSVRLQTSRDLARFDIRQVRDMNPRQGIHIFQSESGIVTHSSEYTQDTFLSRFAHFAGLFTL
jgi:hypothetical protein